jgi:hypothetical protein
MIPHILGTVTRPHFSNTPKPRMSLRINFLFPLKIGIFQFKEIGTFLLVRVTVHIFNSTARSRTS